MAARRPTRRTMPRATKGLERSFPMLDMVLLVLGVGVVLSFSYLAWIIIRGDLTYALIQGTQLGVLRSGLMAGEKALLTCVWLALVLALVRHYKNEGVGYVAVAGGLALWFGMPLFVEKFAPNTAAPELQATAADLMAAFHSSGVAIFVVGLLRVAFGRILMMTYQPSSAVQLRVPGVLTGPEGPESRGSGRHSIMRKCWELHFCRGSVRTTCPRYIENVPCWRRRSGCYCDHDLAGRLMASVGGNASVKMQVAEELETQQRRTQQLQQRMQRQQQRSKALARKICRECPIYLEHQKFKYRALVWTTYPITAVLIAILVGPIKAGYHWADQHAGSFVRDYNFIPQRLMDHPVEVAPWLSAENFAVVIVGVIILTVLLQLTETVVFHWKL